LSAPLVSVRDKMKNERKIWD